MGNGSSVGDHRRAPPLPAALAAAEPNPCPAAGSPGRIPTATAPVGEPARRDRRPRALRSLPPVQSALAAPLRAPASSDRFAPPLNSGGPSRRNSQRGSSRPPDPESPASGDPTGANRPSSPRRRRVRRPFGGTASRPDRLRPGVDHRHGGSGDGAVGRNLRRSVRLRLPQRAAAPLARQRAWRSLRAGMRAGMRNGAWHVPGQSVGPASHAPPYQGRLRDAAPVHAEAPRHVPGGLSALPDATDAAPLPRVWRDDRGRILNAGPRIPPVRKRSTPEEGSRGRPPMRGPAPPGHQLRDDPARRGPAGTLPRPGRGVVFSWHDSAGVNGPGQTPFQTRPTPIITTAMTTAPTTSRITPLRIIARSGTRPVP